MLGWLIDLILPPSDAGTIVIDWPPPPKYVVMPKYVVVYLCVKCKQRLTFKQVMNCHGVCPECGHVSSGTVCDHLKESRPFGDLSK